MRRRRFLQAGLGIGCSVLAGCTELFARGTSGEPPLVENRPDAVYVPTHVDGMAMAGMTDAGPYHCALSYTYPHRFWTVTGRRTNQVSVGEDDTIHLMATLFDRETMIGVPAASLSMAIARDGETVDERSPWPMLSQRMGFHYGDNVSLPEDGTYSVTVEIGALGIGRFGAFEGRFNRPTTAEFELEYSQQRRDEIDYRSLEDRQGERGAVEPMDMEMNGMDMSPAQLPPAEELPGDVRGKATSGDGTFVVTVLEADRFDSVGPASGGSNGPGSNASSGSGAKTETGTGMETGTGRYLAVSARTPYNRFPLPFMALSATLERGDETVYDGELGAGLDPELGYHYGTAVGSVEPGDALRIAVDSPPQVSRHEGYETAFLEMPPMDLRL